jgi:hypothetical protein
MAATVGARIKFDADSRDAERALDRMRDGVDDATGALRKMAQETHDAAAQTERAFEQSEDSVREYSRAVRAAEFAQQKAIDSVKEWVGGFITIQGVIASTRVLVEGIRQSFEALAESNAETAARLELAGLELQNVRRALGEAVIGGEQADVVLSRFAATMRDVADAADESSDGVGFLGERLGGLAVAFDGAVRAGGALGEVLDFTTSLGGLLDTRAGEVANSVFNLGQAFSGPVGFTVAASEALQILNRLGAPAGDIAQVEDRIDELTQTTAVAGPVMSGFFDRMTRGSLEAIPVVNELLARVERITGLDFAGGEEDEREPDQSPSSGQGEQELTEAQRIQQGQALIENARREMEALEDRRLAAKAARADEAAAIDEAEAARAEDRIRRAQKVADAEIEAQQRAAAATKEAFDARVAAAQDFTSAVTASFASVVSGQQSALDAIRQFLGQELIARGGRYALEAAALAFVPGLQGNAAGLAAAAAAMVAGGAALAGGGGGGAGAGGGAAASGLASPAPTSAPTQTINTTVQSNFGIVGDPRQAARLVADNVRTAQREGYLR